MLKALIQIIFLLLIIFAAIAILIVGLISGFAAILGASQIITGIVALALVLGIGAVWLGWVDLV
jgi:hypothetical protein